LTDQGLGLYYDRLTRFTAWARPIGLGGGRRHLTVHRALADPRHEGRATVTRLHDLLFEVLSPLAPVRALDAGCGLGGTMIDLARRCDGTFTGLTLSERQAAIARRAIARAALTPRIEVLVGTYDAPPRARFDVVYAVESLAHSPNPARTLNALTARLAAGGTFVVVDDMPEPAARASPDLAAFMAGWQVPMLLSGEDYTDGLARAGLSLIAAHDLSEGLRRRHRASLAALATLGRWLARLTPGASQRALIDSYRGGLALERLYRDGLMRYRLLVARKPHA
jgi:SAM-dependent methyltransferase